MPKQSNLCIKLLLVLAVLSTWETAIAAGNKRRLMAGDILQWSELPELPARTGVAGAFVGVHNGAVIVAGGANFPDAPPWQGGKKIWRDDIFVLQKAADGTAQWLTNSGYKLPRPLAYGVSVSTSYGVVCVGGCDAERCYDEVFLLKWDPAGKNIEIERMPSLPRPSAFMAGTKVLNTIYVAGGQESISSPAATKNFFALDLSQQRENNSFQWRELASWPGPARVLSVAAGQSNGQTDCFYLFSGRNVAPDRKPELLTDAYQFNPDTEQWKQLADIAPSGEPPRCIMAGTGLACGANHILIFGGADGMLFSKLVTFERQTAALKAQADDQTVERTSREKLLAQAKLLEKERLRILNNHPGFSRDILAYHTITDTWVKAGKLPDTSPVTTTAVKWEGSFVIASGETYPGVRTRKMLKAVVHGAAKFGWVNYAVLMTYLLCLVGMGFYFSKREKSTEDFFKASGRVPWWAAGLSIFGTQLSAITFMAIPAKTYATDWRYLIGNITILLVAPLIIYLFLPFFRRLNVTTAYEYLEKRFNLVARLVASMMFILLHLGRIGIVLFLPSIALSVATGIDIRLCILTMGIICTIYTVLGGIEAVVWNDVVQTTVLLIGAGLAAAVVLFRIEGGPPKLVEMALAEQKFHTFDFSFDFTTPTFWVVLLGGLGVNIISYGSDQTVIQRYLTTKDEKSAARSIWTNGILCMPASLLFFFLGTTLFVFYKSCPQVLNPTLENPDAILPFFIVTQLPAGVSGLLIAAIFAAAMSSLDSSMNSVATAVTTDFYRRFRPDVEDRKCLRLARWVTAIVGIVGVSFALMMAGWGIKSLWDQLFVFVGLLAGGLGGIFLLGIFSRRATGVGAVIGLVGSGLVQYLVSKFTPIYLYLYPFTGVASCLVIGYAASLLSPAKRRTTEGLTIHTIGKYR